MQLTETQRSVRDLYRRYMTAELEPRTPAFESGEEPNRLRLINRVS